MVDKIDAYIAQSFSEETRATNRYEAFALKAHQEGAPGLSRLFRAVADAKSVHSRRFRLLMRGKIGTTVENLKAALEAEVRATEEGYPDRVRLAREAGSTAVKKAFVQSLKTDGEYVTLFRDAAKGETAGGEPVYYVCQICGHISRDAVPENCPICKAVPGRFKRVD